MSQHESAHDEDNLHAAGEGVQRQSFIRTRLVPAFAGLILLAMIGFILFAAFAPESARRNDQRRIGDVLVFDDPSSASEFELEPIEGGDPVSLEDLRGKVVLLNFWASWCGPCEDEIPILIEASRQFPDDVVLVGIDTMDNRESAIEMMEEFGINYMVLDDNGSASGSVAVDYGLVGVPENYVVDADGKLVAMRRGEFQTVQQVLDIVELAR
ncbi:MAG: TlpA family protein disulfide reductase [Chloroflexota bacterium]